jgi:hypothetical protein
MGSVQHNVPLMNQPLSQTFRETFGTPKHTKLIVEKVEQVVYKKEAEIVNCFMP